MTLIEKIIVQEVEMTRDGVSGILTEVALVLELWDLGISGRDEDDFNVDLSDDTMCGTFTIMMGFVMISRTFTAICSSVTPYRTAEASVI